MDNKLKGYLLIIIAVIISSFVAIFAKIVQQTMSTENAAFYWFLSAAIWSTIFLFVTKKQKAMVNAVKKSWKKLLLFGVFNGIAVLFFFYSVNAIGAAATTFLDRVQVIYMVLLGVIFLKEKFNKFELMGLTVAVIGVFAFSYSSNTLFNYKTLYILIGTIFFSIAQLIAKREVKNTDPIILVFIRAVLTMTLLFFVVLALSKPVLPGKNLIILLILAPTLSAVFQFILLYEAFKYVDLSKAVIVQSLMPLLTWGFAWWLIGEVLEPLQVIGGILILVGVFAIILFKRGEK